MLEYIRDAPANSRVYSVFRITNWVSGDPKYAIAVAVGMQMKKTNELLDLPAIYEQHLLEHNRKAIEGYHSKGTRVLFIIDISHFPYIATALDTTPPTPEAECKDSFDRDIARVWAMPMDTIPTIVVNLHLPHTALKQLGL